MTPRRLLILGALAVATIAIGLWISRSSTSSGPDLDAQLYPSLEKELDSVTSVKLLQAGDVPAVELQRGASGWTVAERSGYPADVAKLRKLLLDLAEAKVIEEKTANPQSYATLGVEDTSQPSATGSRVQLAGVSKPVDLIVGKMAPGAKSRYVRRAGEPQSWLVDRTLDTSTTADAWLRKEIIDVSADRIQSARITLGGAKAYAAEKSGRAAANFDVQGLPRGKELSSPSAANALATSLAGLALTDVRHAKDFVTPGADVADVKTFDGLAIRIEGWKQGEKRYIAVKTAFDAAQAERSRLPVEAPASEGAPSSPPASATIPNTDEKVRQEADSIQQKVAGWVYEIPEYKYDAIFKPLEDLLKK
jgi:hypothetical protein